MSDNKISIWLEDTCGVSQRKAVEVANRFIDELWISDVEALKNCVECSPGFLEKHNFPLAVQLAVKSQVFVKLQDLSVNDVKTILQLAFQEEPLYALRFHAAKINGTVLATIKNHQTLFDWGVDNIIHAEAFLRRIEQWKEEGVAISQLRTKQCKKHSYNNTNGSSSSTMVHDKIQETEISDAKVSESCLHGVTPEQSDGEVDDALEMPASVPNPADEFHTTKDGELLASLKSVPLQNDCAVLDVLRAVEPDFSDNSDDSSVRTPKHNRKMNKFTDPGERMSSRVKNPCQLYDPVPVKRAERKTGRVEVRAREKAPSRGSDKDDDLIATDRPPKIARRVTTSSATGPNAAIVQLVEQIDSGKVTLQTKALNALHKMVADDSSIVAAMSKGGAVDKLLDMLRIPDEIDTTVLVAVLDVVNTIIALSRDSNVDYIMEQGVIALVQPLCMSAAARVRILAVWIIGNAGTIYFKELVIRPTVIASLIESYESIAGFKNRELTEMRDRFGETMKQLCSGSVSSQFYTLTKLIPIMVDIIAKEDRVEPVTSACEALNHLIDSNGTNAVDVFVSLDVIPALVGRLTASRAMIVFSSLRALAFIAACSNETQIQALDPVMCRLQDLVLGSDAEAPSQKVFAQAGLLVSMLCKHGERPIKRIMDESPDVFQQFFDVLNLRTALQVKQGKVNTKAQNSALALMYAAQRGNNSQLAYLLGQGLYTLCFRVLATFDDIPNLLVQTLKALRRLVVKVENIDEVQRGEDEFNADKAWSRVRVLMHTNKAGSLRPQDVVADSDSGMENDSQSTTDAKVRKYATRLYDAAVQQGLLPN